MEPEPGRRADTTRRVDWGQHKHEGNEITWPPFKGKLAPTLALVYQCYATMKTSIYVMKEPACWRTGASQAPPSPVQVYDGSPQLRAATPSLRLVHHHLHAVELLLLHLHPRVRHRHHVLHQGDQVHHAHVVLQPQRLAQLRLEAESKAIRELPCLHPTWAINTPSCGHNEATSKLLIPMFSSWAELIAFGRKKKKKV